MGTTAELYTTFQFSRITVWKISTFGTLHMGYKKPGSADYHAAPPGSVGIIIASNHDAWGIW